VILIIGGILLWLGTVVLALALCRAAARGDDQLGYKAPLNPVGEYFARAEESKLRTYSRQGIRELPPLGHKRIGIDK
jgi:hypothetical protein